MSVWKKINTPQSEKLILEINLLPESEQNFYDKADEPVVRKMIFDHRIFPLMQKNSPLI